MIMIGKTLILHITSRITIAFFMNSNGIINAPYNLCIYTNDKYLKRA